MIRLLAIADSKGWAIPLFCDNRINRAIIKMADEIIKRRTHVHRDRRKFPIARE